MVFQPAIRGLLLWLGGCRGVKRGADEIILPADSLSPLPFLSFSAVRPSPRGREGTYTRVGVPSNRNQMEGGGGHSGYSNKGLVIDQRVVPGSAFGGLPDHRHNKMR
ncbi:hypothetical protein LX36DRAFT_449168 [Colletotrichum falcatum]|nr:hypothetical protein LX36DRAFT_449168 [Colletotrichum falcatum]